MGLGANLKTGREACPRVRAGAVAGSGAWRCWARALPGAPRAFDRPRLRHNRAHRYTKAPPANRGRRPRRSELWRGAAWQIGGSKRDATRRPSKRGAPPRPGERRARAAGAACHASSPATRMSARACARCGDVVQPCAWCTMRPAIRPCAASPRASRGWPESSSASSYRWRAHRRSGCARLLLCQPFEPFALSALEDAALACRWVVQRRRSAPCGRSARPAPTVSTWRGSRASSDAQIRSALTAISGIGPWTADIYMTVLSRPWRWICGGRPGPADRRAEGVRSAGAAERRGVARNRRALATLARGGRPSVVELLRPSKKAGQGGTGIDGHE